MRKRFLQTVKTADQLLQELFPICRSLTGEGVRTTLKLLQRVATFESKHIPSGTECFDWTVPDEWNITDAFIKDASGKRIIDFKKSNIHVVSYSIPIHRVMTFAELEPHLHYLENLPTAVPYRTSYYQRDWGFCLSYEQFKQLDRQGKYEVCIESRLEPGELSYGEAVIKGSSQHEFLISSYCCHPSLANDNLSGVVLWTLLLQELQKRTTRHSYRFILIPETIGSIAYLHSNQSVMKKSAGGFVLSTVAGPGPFGYKQSFLGNHLIDRVIRQTFFELGIEPRCYPFDAYGSDEVRYASPYFRIPTGTICKDKYYEYEYYHTSLDNLDFVRAEYLVQTLQLYLAAIEMLEQNYTYQTNFPYVEPMLGKRGLYPSIGGSIKQKATSSQHVTHQYKLVDRQAITGTQLDAMKWLLFDCDGSKSLLDIAEQRKMSMSLLFETAELLRKEKLLNRKVDT